MFIKCRDTCVQQVGKGFTGSRDARAYVSGAGFDGFGNSAAAFIDAADQAFARFGEQGAQLLRGRKNIVADDVGSARKFFLELFVRARDRRTHALGMADDSFTLVTEVTNQRTNANFIIAIGAFQLIDFGLNKRFQLDGPRQCAFDAFVHGGDFATHSLSKSRNAITGNSFRLEQPHGSFRHAARSQMHFLRTLYELRKSPEHGDGQGYTSHDAETGG